MKDLAEQKAAPVSPPKAFQLRRAGLLPVDTRADEAYLDTLAIVERDPKDVRRELPPRALTAAERKAVAGGTLIPNGVMPGDARARGGQAP